MTHTPEIPFDNSYVKLSDKLFSRQQPTPVSQPELMAFNTDLAKQLGLNAEQLQSADGVSVLAGNSIPSGAEPIATVYAGHQFGNWVPQLGDGRAILLGEVLDEHGTRFDIQLKGAGPTPYSRNGDGRAAVGPVVREYIVSEAMAALGVPTTRALAAVATGDRVRRETQLPGAILARVAQSHIRVGTFQFFAAKRDTESLELLATHVIDRHYPEIQSADNPPLALLEAVVAKQVKLIAQWQSIGFIHGVMNTDNASVAGLTIDYGPCAFMDVYHPQSVFSSIDHGSRYAYQNQPGIAQWNCANLAQCLLPLIDTDDDNSIKAAQAVIDSFPESYSKEYLSVFRRKLGLSLELKDDQVLISDLLEHMANAKTDFTNTFRALSFCSFHKDATESTNATFVELFADYEPITDWLNQWRSRHDDETDDAAMRQTLMRQSNPAYIPRNHQVEKIIDAAEQQNYAPMHEFVKILSTPFIEQDGMSAYSLPPKQDEIVQATFCGT